MMVVFQTNTALVFIVSVITKTNLIGACFCRLFKDKIAKEQN